MSLSLASSSSFLQNIPISRFKSLTLTTLHGSASPLSLLTKPSSTAPPPPATFLLPIKAMKSLQGRVVCATNDKTVSVEVVRLAPHPKYKRRVRKMKKYQAHDSENRFKVGDFVQLEKSRPISKTKTFVAVPAVGRRSGPQTKDGGPPKEIGLPLESQQKSFE